MSVRTHLRTASLAALLVVAVLGTPAFQGAALAASERDSNVPDVAVPSGIQPAAKHGTVERQPVTERPFIIYPNTEIWD